MVLLAYCANCGTKNDDGMMFCFNCGCNIENPESQLQTNKVDAANSSFSGMYYQPQNKEISVNNQNGQYITNVNDQKSSKYANISLILGVLGSGFTLVFLSPFALILGIIARKRNTKFRTRATVGMVLGIEGTLVLLWLIFMFSMGLINF